MTTALTESMVTPEPIVRLINAFEVPYDNAVATARTCYSPRIVLAEEVGKDEQSRVRRDAIAKSTYLAGHHTTLQHATFQFAIERVSRHCIWSFLHSHPFYNSEQVSQRYVAVARENFSVPSLPEKCMPLYQEAVGALMEAYQKLQELLKPAVEKEYQRLFPNRDLSEKRWAAAIKKKCQELARYVLPVATHAHLYHTIPGITLLRYRRICRSFDVPEEQRSLVEKMTAAVAEVDKDFLKNAEDPLPLEETPEYEYFARNGGDRTGGNAAFLAEFDDSLEGHVSRLVDYKANSEAVMADAVRSILGVSRAQLGQETAISMVMDPARNRYLTDTLNLSQHTKLNRAMVHPHFTFRKKISHTADSQDQRHRTVPGSRPVLACHFTAKPDFMTPALISATPAALEFYNGVMAALWRNMGRMLDAGAELESVLYLLPNAFPIRFEESGSLIDFHHKWVHRLCYTAQEEIWRSCLEEVKQVKAVFPAIGRHLYAPCALRKNAERKPHCPEGDRFCGVAVWKMGVDDYSRIL